MTLDEKLTTEELTSMFTREEDEGTMMYVVRVNDVKLRYFMGTCIVHVDGQVTLDCYKKRKSDTRWQRFVTNLYGEYEHQWGTPDSGIHESLLSSVYPLWRTIRYGYTAKDHGHWLEKRETKRENYVYGRLRCIANQQGKMVSDVALDSVFEPIFRQVEDLFKEKAPRLLYEAAHQPCEIQLKKESISSPDRQKNKIDYKNN